jgi:hypothetical protein
VEPRTDVTPGVVVVADREIPNGGGGPDDVIKTCAVFDAPTPTAKPDEGVTRM